MIRQAAHVLLLFALFVVPVGAKDIAVKTSSGIKIKGKLKSVSEKGIVLFWSGREKEFTWEQLHPETVYEIRKSRGDAASAEDHIKLGDYCAENDLPALARKEYQTALKLDPTMKDRVDEAVARISEPAEERIPPQKEKMPQPKPKDPPPQNTPKEAAKKSPQQMTKTELMNAGAELMKKMHEDPVKYHNEWIQLQRLHLKQVEEKLKYRFFTYETEHYIYHSTMSPATTRKISNGCEDLYKKMCKAFKVGKGDLLWAGKCVVNLFDKRSQFIEFAIEIDGVGEDSAQNIGGYFSHRGRFVHIAIPRTSQGGKGFEATLIHEGAHAFLQLFNEDVFIKPWIHEGVAQYFEHKCFPKSQEWTSKRITIRNERMSLSDLRRQETFISPSAYKMQKWYAFSWSALDYMIRANPKKFVKFIRAFKKGKTEEEAIKIAFGKTMREFEQAWLSYARKSK